MAFVYILGSETIGSTDNLPRRLEEHGRGHSLAARGRGPWKLVYQQPLASLREARRRELEIERWKSSKMVQALINGSVG